MNIQLLNKNISDMTLAEMDVYWEESKKDEQILGSRFQKLDKKIQ